MDKSPRSLIPPPPDDPLKHFSKDKPAVKLTALLICKLPLILGSLSGLGLLVTAVVKLMRQ
jgi:hypothetical protein